MCPAKSPSRPRTSYDAVPYLSYPSALTHPARSAAIAALYGMTPPAVSTARILELGCATGGNIIPLAEIYPQSTIVGVDLSQEQIAYGQRIIQHLGLKNIRLLQCSITELKDDIGTFDFIICHGVFSWVPRAVQDKILEICVRHLASNGISYVDYNIYPGWHGRGMVREMMQYHVRDIAEPRQQVEEARRFVEFIARSALVVKTGFRNLLADELDYMAGTPDEYVFHEYLEEVNEPVYFHKFIERVTACGLQYIADSRLETVAWEALTPEVCAFLKKYESDYVRYEQYLDFLTNRAFRRSLLCHREVPLVRGGLHERVDRFYIASTVPPVTFSASDSFPEEIIDPLGRRFRVSDVTLKSLVSTISRSYPQAIPYREIVQTISTSDEIHLRRQLLRGFCQNLFAFYTEPVPLSFTLTEKPIASPLARYQAEMGDVVSTFHHRAIKLTPLERAILRYLDGEHAKEQIITDLMGKIERGELSAPSSFRDTLSHLVTACLERFRTEGLLR